MTHVQCGQISWDRVFRAVEKVRERMFRAARALEKAGVPYAVVGGNAVAAWVSSVDELAVRFTQDVDILVSRDDLAAAVQAMAEDGFVHRHAAGVDFFLDGADAKARDAVHVVFAGEKVRPEYALPAPGVDGCQTVGGVRVLPLESLVRMKLTSFRRKDQVHLLDLIQVGLVDAAWPERLPPELAARLRELLESPDG